MTTTTAQDTAFNLISQFEGFRPKPYFATADEQKKGLLTIGYGFTELNGQPVKLTDIIDRQAANTLLKDHIQFIIGKLNKMFEALTENQQAALCSLIFNIGMNKFMTSTMFKYIRSEEFDKAVNEFPKWCHQDGKVLSDLVKRRADERSVFLS